MGILKTKMDDEVNDWWSELNKDELIKVYKQTNNFRMGGWGHDIGPTEEDVVDMYNQIHI